MNCSSLDFIFPVVQKGIIGNQATFVFNGIPTIITLLIFALYTLFSKSYYTFLPRIFFIFIGIVCIGLTDLMIWRLFEIFECKKVTQFLSYKFLIIVAVPIVTSILLILAFSRNINKITTLLSISLAGSCIFFDYYTRKYLSEEAAFTIFPAQVFLCSFSLCCLLSQKGKKRVLNSGVYSDSTEKNEVKVKGNNDKLTKKVCMESHFMDPTSRHPLEGKTSGSAPEYRYGWS